MPTKAQVVVKIETKLETAKSDLERLDISQIQLTADRRSLVGKIALLTELLAEPEATGNGKQDEEKLP